MSLCLSQAADGPIARQLQPTVAQRCHTDALHCIFAFLSLKELLPALHSCRQWLAAGAKEPPRGLKLVIDPESFAALVSSPLRHHVGHLLTAASASLDQLRLLRTLSRLTALNVCLDAGELEAVPGAADDARPQRAPVPSAAFPPQICSIEIDIQSVEPASLCARQAVVDALPSAPSLQTIKLNFITDDLDLSPLLQLPQLSDLRMHKSPSLEQCAAVKQLAALTKLNLTSKTWDRDALLALLQPPHALQHLQDLSFGNHTLDPPVLDALLTLPAFTRLHLRQIEPECWAGLGGFAQLKKLTVIWPEPFTAEQRSALQSSLDALPHLTDLFLGLRFDSQVDGPPLTLRLPALRSLDLGCVRLPSLAFLQHSPLLEKLYVSYCPQMSADDTLRCLQSFAPQLRFLSLNGCACLSADQVRLLRPPSALLPGLSKLAYFPTRQ